MKIRIHPQSIIDIITNSSTEIYTFPSSDAKNMVVKIVNEVLKAAGSDKTFNDLYTIAEVPSDEAWNDFSWWLESEHPEFMESNSDLNPMKASVWLTENKEKALKLFENFVDDYHKYEGNPGLARDIEIVALDGTPSGLASLIRNVFESVEVNN
jgi:hypothetical protein